MTRNDGLLVVGASILGATLAGVSPQAGAEDEGSAGERVDDLVRQVQGNVEDLETVKVIDHSRLAAEAKISAFAKLHYGRAIPPHGMIDARLTQTFSGALEAATESRERPSRPEEDGLFTASVVRERSPG